MAPPYALVVEGDPEAATLFRRALQDAGFQADVVANGHKAQARLVFTTPDLIIMDMVLPRISGSVLLRQIRGQRRLDRARLIVTMAEDQVNDEVAGEADYVLVKPVGYDQVHELAAALVPTAV